MKCDNVVVVVDTFFFVFFPPSSSSSSSSFVFSWAESIITSTYTTSPCNARFLNVPSITSHSGLDNLTCKTINSLLIIFDLP
jgi:hypothetical protein